MTSDLNSNYNVNLNFIDNSNKTKLELGPTQPQLVVLIMIKVFISFFPHTVSPQQKNLALSLTIVFNLSSFTSNIFLTRTGFVKLLAVVVISLTARHF